MVGLFLWLLCGFLWFDVIGVSVCENFFGFSEWARS